MHRTICRVHLTKANYL
uniref:BLTX312 n=1 Tax=Nephila pilipes TaxID=299642 RepID=A0A076KUM7_NEPPI|nr:BLTX312 [Nephila pilipes]